MEHNTNLFQFVSQDLERTSAIHFNLCLFFKFLASIDPHHFIRGLFPGPPCLPHYVFRSYKRTEKLITAGRLGSFKMLTLK